MFKLFPRILNNYIIIGSLESDSKETLLRKKFLLLIPLIIGIAAFLWGLIYIAFGHYLSASIPLSYSLISVFNIWQLAKTKNIAPLLTTQLTLVLLLPFVLMWSLGGFAAGSFVLIWAFYAPITALIYQSRKVALQWLAGFFILTLVSASIDQSLLISIKPMPTLAIELFYILNVLGGSTGIFFIIQYFMKEKEKRADAILLKEHNALLQSTEALKNTHGQLELIIKSTNLGIWDWYVQTGKTIFNERWANIIGYTLQELHPISIDTWMKYVYPDDLLESGRLLEEHWAGKTEFYIFEARMKHKDGHWVWVYDTGQVVEWESDGLPKRMIGTHSDISHRKKTEERLHYQSSHDGLTGLVNRREFERRAEALLASKVHDKSEHALCYIDLDQFKVVNDTCGHAAGDEMLRQLGAVLKNVVKASDTLARLGGDEFGVLITNCSIDRAHQLASLIKSAIQDYQFIYEEQSFRVSASIGLVSIVGLGNTLSRLLKNADAACYMAKDSGRNRIHVSHINDEDLTQRHGEMQWVNRIQKALAENRFCLYAQSIESLKNHTKIHYELLIRMQDEQGGIILPGAFLPAAERYNLIVQVDLWVIDNAFSLLEETPTFLDNVDFISINLSGHSLTDESVLEFIVSKLNQHKVDGNKFCFEITETAAISNLLQAENFINELKKFGCQFALDDFGSGLSSFGYLKNLPVDYLKIDGIFVKDILEDKIDYAMVKSINEVGHIMGMQTIAEFVENDEIKHMLRELGVDYAQGYGIHKPQPFQEILEFTLKNVEES
jgi:diguanylate cyclase (GGDEF)-like protein/PAS domain S-box-containing protein